MSKKYTQIIQCPNCKKETEVTVWESVNTHLYENVASDIISGKFFKEKCSHCQYEISMEYDILYHDIGRSAMIWVLHPSDSKYMDAVQRVRRMNALNYPYTRIVSSISELREKISALESGRDDRHIELEKIHMLKQLQKNVPELGYGNPFYTFIDGEESITFRNESDKLLVMSLVDTTIPDEIEKIFGNILKNLPKEDYSIYDKVWAEKFYKQFHEDITEIFREEINKIEPKPTAQNIKTAKQTEKVRVKVPLKKQKTVSENHTISMTNNNVATDNVGSDLAMNSLHKNNIQKTNTIFSKSWQINWLAIVLSLVIVLLTVVTVNQKSLISDLKTEIIAHDLNTQEIIGNVKNLYKGNNVGAASTNFFASDDILVMRSWNGSKTIKITCKYNASISVSNSGNAVTTEWSPAWYYDTIDMYVYPNSKGISTLTFTNDANLETFKVMVVVL